ncbi:MAG: hypothetical protein HC822_18580 [Oscillochloris sp.]|nr:hypothetical protein [Oscillochloris sp.]
MDATAPPAEFASIDEYIAAFPADVQVLLKQLRATIKAAAPEAEERISYKMPTFSLHGNLVHFAAYKQHIGLYPTPSGMSAFDAELAPYKRAKGSVQFPLSEPLPLDLVTRIVQARVAQNLQRAAEKSGRRKRS